MQYTKIHMGGYSFDIEIVSKITSAYTTINIKNLHIKIGAFGYAGAVAQCEKLLKLLNQRDTGRYIIATNVAFTEGELTGNWCSYNYDVHENLQTAVNEYATSEPFIHGSHVRVILPW